MRAIGGIHERSEYHTRPSKSAHARHVPLPRIRGRVRDSGNSGAYQHLGTVHSLWSNHGSRTRSKFEYRTPRVLARFDKKRAREITPDGVRGFLADLRTTGMRKGEILSRRWSDIDLDSGNPCVYVR